MYVLLDEWLVKLETGNDQVDQFRPCSPTHIISEVFVVGGGEGGRGG